MAKSLLVISGATACGKSELAMQLALEKNIEIINADSLQLYQGLPILSSQPLISDQKKVKHHLYSHLKADENCSVGLWLKMIEGIVKKIWEENKLPVFVGGSGLYISKLIDGISEIPAIDFANKKLAQEMYENLGHQHFLQEYGEGKIIDKNRLIRACEVFLQTQKTIFFWQEQSVKKTFPQAKIFHYNLNLEREKIYQNCNLRFEKMLKNGAIDEVKNLVAQGINDEMPITKTLGFHEICAYLKNEISYEKMQNLASQKTRNYAKRQLTWFRHQFEEITFFENPRELLNHIKNNEI